MLLYSTGFRLPFHNSGMSIRNDSMIEQYALLEILKAIRGHEIALMEDNGVDVDIAVNELNAAQTECLEQLESNPSPDAFTLTAEIEMVERMQSRAKRANYVKLTDIHRKLTASEALNTRHRHGLTTKADALRIACALLTITEQQLGNVDTIAESAIELIRNASVLDADTVSIHA